MTSGAPLTPPHIRASTEADISAIQEIYAHHVLHGVASFEIEPPDAAEIAQRRRVVLDAGFPHLVAERDGEIVGYAYVGPYRSRPGYRCTVENSIYVRHDCARQGIGRLLLDAVIAHCEAAGFRQMVAVIGDSGNIASIALHRRAGFEQIGTLKSVGCKFGRWIDTVLMQRPLGLGANALPP